MKYLKNSDMRYDSLQAAQEIKDDTSYSYSFISRYVSTTDYDSTPGVYFQNGSTQITMTKSGNTIQYTIHKIDAEIQKAIDAGLAYVVVESQDCAGLACGGRNPMSSYEDRARTAKWHMVDCIGSQQLTDSMIGRSLTFSIPNYYKVVPPQLRKSIYNYRFWGTEPKKHMFRLRVNIRLANIIDATKNVRTNSASNAVTVDAYDYY